MKVLLTLLLPFCLVANITNENLNGFSCKNYVEPQQESVLSIKPSKLAENIQLQKNKLFSVKEKFEQCFVLLQDLSMYESDSSLEELRVQKCEIQSEIWMLDFYFRRINVLVNSYGLKCDLVVDENDINRFEQENSMEEIRVYLLKCAPSVIDERILSVIHAALRRYCTSLSGLLKQTEMPMKYKKLERKCLRLQKKISSIERGLGKAFLKQKQASAIIKERKSVAAKIPGQCIEIEKPSKNEEKAVGETATHDSLASNSAKFVDSTIPRTASKISKMNCSDSSKPERMMIFKNIFSYCWKFITFGVVTITMSYSVLKFFK